MLFVRLVAVSLVVFASMGDAAMAKAPASHMQSDDEADRADGDTQLAKGRSRLAPKPDGVAKPSSQGRTASSAVIESTDDDGSGSDTLPSRQSAYVCPSDMVMIGRSYCIDAYEAALVQVLPNGTEQTWPYYQVLPHDVVARAISVAGVYPQGYVSGLQARDACRRSGKRLCKPTEWTKACMGPKHTTFPYGNQRQRGRCNDDGRSAMLFFNKGLDNRPEHRYRWGLSKNMIDPRLNQLEGTLTRTGERAGCTNEYGVFDMVGNLHEWVEDPKGTFQGGYYLDTHLNGDGCHYRTTAHPISHLDYSTGFRCCADVAGL